MILSLCLLKTVLTLPNILSLHIGFLEQNGDSMGTDRLNMTKISSQTEGSCHTDRNIFAASQSEAGLIQFSAAAVTDFHILDTGPSALPPLSPLLQTKAGLKQPAVHARPQSHHTCTC